MVFPVHHANANPWRRVFRFESDSRLDPASGWWRSILAATGQLERFT